MGPEDVDGRDGGVYLQPPTGRSWTHESSVLHLQQVMRPPWAQLPRNGRTPSLELWGPQWSAGSQR